MLNREDKNCGQAWRSSAVDSRRPLVSPLSHQYYLYANDMSATSQNNAVSHFLPPDPSNESFPMGGVRGGAGGGVGAPHANARVK